MRCETGSSAVISAQHHESLEPRKDHLFTKPAGPASLDFQIEMGKERGMAPVDCPVLLSRYLQLSLFNAQPEFLAMALACQDSNLKDVIGLP